nr:hypothetical protein [Tanacetum cinerariifolium]
HRPNRAAGGAVNRGTIQLRAVVIAQLAIRNGAGARHRHLKNNLIISVKPQLVDAPKQVRKAGVEGVLTAPVHQLLALLAGYAVKVEVVAGALHLAGAGIGPPPTPKQRHARPQRLHRAFGNALAGRARARAVGHQLFGLRQVGQQLVVGGVAVRVGCPLGGDNQVLRQEGTGACVRAAMYGRSWSYVPGLLALPLLVAAPAHAQRYVEKLNRSVVAIRTDANTVFRPAGGTTPDGVAYTYSANDASVGDVDGDGEYEIILKWDPSNSKDNSQSGYTGNVYLDAYELDGTRLWRIDLGRNIRAGAHYTQFMVYDLDSDGKAEV